MKTCQCPQPVVGSAIFDRTGQYRYLLSRVWNKAGLCVLFVMLNPSTANADADDPTIRRCMGFASSWEMGAFVVANLYAFRATQPAVLFQAADPVGPDNDLHLEQAMKRADRVVLAWGNHGLRDERATEVLGIIKSLNIKPMCLGLTNAGQPRHPLYLPGNASLQSAADLL